MNWRLGSVTSEALLNFLSTPLRSLVLVGLYAALLGALALAELAFSSDLIAFAHQYEQSGGFVAVAGSDAGLPAAQCEALNSRPDVIAAGGIVSTGPDTLTTAPGTRFNTAAVTANAIRVWDTTPPTPVIDPTGVVIGRALADELGLRPGMMLNLGATGPASIVATADTEQRNPYVSRWLFSVAPATDKIDECWVEFQPGAFTAGLALLPTIFGDTAPSLNVRPWITLDEFARDPLSELGNRTQRFGWLAVALLSALLTALITWFRRSELALYRALGTPQTTIWVLTQIEVCTVAALALPLAISWGFAVHSITNDAVTTSQLLLALRSTCLATAASVAVAPLASLLVGRHALMNLLKGE